MKKRIIALILAVVMSLLTLSSCSNSFDFAEENLDAYAEFDVEKFLEDLQKLEIEDGEFTTDADTREKLVAAKIYNTIVDKIIAQTKEEDRLGKDDELTEGDVLYFVYYAKDADGNVFFGSDMNVSTITASSTKANHVVKLDDYLEGDSKEFFKLIAENLKDGKLNPYKMLTKAELEADAEEALKETKPEATKEEITAAKAEAIKVKAGDKIYISYTRTYTTTVDGNEVTITEKAAYEQISLDDKNASAITNNLATAILGATTAAVGGTVVTANPIEITDNDVKYTYKDVKVLWKVETEGDPIAVFEYTPYDSDKNVAPDSIYSSTKKVNLKDKALTYYVYPVYAIDAPATEEITAADVLYYVNGSGLTDKSYDAFKEKYANGDETLESLLKDVKLIFATEEKDNKFYAEESELAKLLKAYKDLGGANPTTEQKDANAKAKTALTDAQNAVLKTVVAKIAAAKLDDKVLGDEILEQYEHDTFHSLKEAYDADIVSKVQAEVLELIYSSVKVKDYPAELVEEYVDHLYESYEYQYYTGDFDKNTSNVKKYATFEEYLEKTLKVTGEDKVREAIVKEAKEAIEPVIKIFVVSKALKDRAVTAMSGPNGYIEADIADGAYLVDEEAYRDYYGEDADKYIEEANKNADESKKSAREESGRFLVNDAYMKYYKKNVGSAFYRSQIEAYGEINLRTAIQFNKLFYYLTCTEITFNEEEGHAEIRYTADGTKIDFRTVDYTIADPNAETENEAE